MKNTKTSCFVRCLLPHPDIFMADIVGKQTKAQTDAEQ